LIDIPLFYLVALPAVFITGLSKGGFGGGIAFVGVPTMALFVEPLVAAAIMLPILMVMDAASLKAFWRKWSVPHLKILVPAAMIGTLAGTFSASYMNDDLFRVFLAILAIGFALHLLWQLFESKLQMSTRPSAWKGWFWGALAGYASFFAHAGSPPINVYMLPQKLDKTVYQATLVFFFASINISKIVPYLWLGTSRGKVF
jgi:uncharacterized membrane protein YfcA